MFAPLRLMLSHIIKTGDITFVDAQGRPHRFGDRTPPALIVKLTDHKLERELVRDPELAAGEAYMQGRLVTEKGSIYDFLSIMMRNLETIRLPPSMQWMAGLRWLKRRIAQFNPVWRSRSNVTQHYDIDPRIFDLFLDRDRQYSCAYFASGTDLEMAQLAKKRHIAAKLAIKPGQRVLDIGSGWGGLALYLAKVTDAHVTGITLSRKQMTVAQKQAWRAKLAKNVEFKLNDYRSVTGHYDRIVSIGMFEHVGVPHYQTFFQKINQLLNIDGVALLHTIGRIDGPGVTNPFIAKYIFPGGYSPSLSEITKAIEPSGLILTDVEVLRLHYAETLRAWRQRFLSRREEAVKISSEEFVRMWEFYLAGSEAAFRFQNLVVFQIQLTKRLETLPITRNYMHEAERDLFARESDTLETPQVLGEGT